MKYKIDKKTSLLAGLLLLTSTSTYALARQTHTPMLTGFLGLNTVPSTRMDKSGTIRTGMSTLDPYLHSFIGLQIAEPLFVNVRQSAKTSNILKNTERLYPGIDIKLRLAKENAHTPQIALGIQSALGHRRQAGEFIALSKRHNNFDFTAGLGWGRYGTARHLDNPFKILGSHFDDQRDLNSERANTPSQWFTGDKVGIFGGIEYFLPIKGLSLKLDYGSDRYSIETKDPTFEAPSPWGLGISYAPTKWINGGFGIQGTNKISARLTLKANPKNWKYNNTTQYKRPISNGASLYKSQLNPTQNIRTQENLGIEQIYTQNKTAFITLKIPKNTNAPSHIRKAIEHIEHKYQKDLTEIKEYAFTIKKHTLKGTTIRFSRAELLRAEKNNASSPQELWFTANNNASKEKIDKKAKFLPTKALNQAPMFITKLENKISLSEEDIGIIYRSSLLIGAENLPIYGTVNAATLRLNLIDNIDKLERPPSIFKKPTRSNVNEFTQQRVTLENAYIGLATNITPKLHLLLLSGYLEEMYAGLGGEVLYRAPQSRFAVGGELWYTAKRDPSTDLNIGLTKTTGYTGFANIWYDIPRYDVTANLKLGQFLAGDKGIAIGLEKTFENGAKLNTSLRLSNTPEPDQFGKDLHAFQSINLVLPINRIPKINTGVKMQIAPFGRDIAQSLNKPARLYDITEPFTIDHIAKNWNKIIK